VYDQERMSDGCVLRKSIWKRRPVPAFGLMRSQFHIVCTESPTLLARIEYSLLLKWRRYPARLA
jgi:hypothetical protein